MSKLKQINHINVGRKAQEKEGFQYNWEPLDINHLQMPQTKKAIFLFGGNSTDSDEASNGNAKQIISLLNPELLDSTDIYSFGYDSEPIMPDNYILSKEYEEEAVLLFEKTFKPILFDKNGNMKEKKGVEQALGKIVLAAHCGGSNFVNIIIDNLYNTLLQKYHPTTAELLINKIQYYAYAPNEMPNHNVNALIVAPFIDPGFSSAKALIIAETQKVDIDYPKGVVKRLLKAKQLTKLHECFINEFKETRSIMFKIGNTTYLIPSRMNPHTTIGDHSIECATKQHIVNSGTEYANTAKIVNLASKLYLNEFLTNNMMDYKGCFTKVANKIESTPPNNERFS